MATPDNEHSNMPKGNGLMLKEAPFGLEHVAGYEAGGHHPVHLGDRLGEADRYRVIHKLGHGGYANVWLCRDKKRETPKYVALKIMMAEVSTEDCQELRGAEFLQANLASELRKYVCLPLDRFWHDGPNGMHLCFVFPVLGPWVSRMPEAFRDVDETLRDVALQAVQAMAALHMCGLCHRDFTPSNILLKLTGLDSLSEDDVLREFGKPDRVTIFTTSGSIPTEPSAPRHLVGPIDFRNVDPRFITNKACMIDLGQSFHPSTPPEELGIPRIYGTPELLLEKTAGFGSHLWALGCTIYQIRTGRKLFNLFDQEIDDLLYSMVLLRGPLPQPWWTTWKLRKDIFKDEADAEGRAMKVEPLTAEQEAKMRSNVHASVAQDPRCFADSLAPGYWYTEGERWVHRVVREAETNLFADLLGRIMKYNPNDRMTARAALHHEWFTMRGMENVTPNTVDGMLNTEAAVPSDGGVGSKAVEATSSITETVPKSESTALETGTPGVDQAALNAAEAMLRTEEP